MSVGISNTEQAPSAAAPAKELHGDAVTGTEAISPSTIKDESTRSDAECDSKSEEDSAPTQATSSLLASLWSPISFLLQGPKTAASGSPELPVTNPTTQTKENDDTQSSSVAPSPSSTNKPIKPSPQSQPEAYYNPNDVPLFKALHKKRLSGTRTKQLLRAASRAYNDPPPPPELGTCCGSSCDPCVNDLWREERDVWRERWGDRRVEGESGSDGGGRKELEW